MNYSVKEEPKVIYDAITYQFTLTDENGKEYEIRKWEDTKGGGYYIWNEENRSWEDFYPEGELQEFLTEEMEF